MQRIGCGILIMILGLAALTTAGDIRPAPIRQNKPQPPRLQNREGWLTFTNQDWMDYYVAVDSDQARLSLSDQNNGGYRIPSGGYLALPLDRAMWEIYGDHGKNMVEVRIRPGTETQFTLTPTGKQGDSGLLGIASENGRRHSATLFTARTTPPRSTARNDTAAYSRINQPTDNLVGNVMNEMETNLVNNLTQPSPYQ